MNFLRPTINGLHLVVATIGFALASAVSYLLNHEEYISKYLLYTIAIILSVATVGVAGWLDISSPYSTTIQLDRIYKEKREITEKIEKEKSDIFFIIQLNLNQLTEYYTINKAQARNSFTFSIGAASAGFITLLSGIWFYYSTGKNIPVTYITSIAGIILEFIGGAYFFIYKKSLEQVGLFFGQLIKIQDTMLAIDLAKQSENPERRSELQEKIIVSLLERSLK